MEIEKNKPTFITSVLKVVYYVGLVFSNSNFVINKSPREGNLFVKKVPSSANSALFLVTSDWKKLDCPSFF